MTERSETGRDQLTVRGSAQASLAVIGMALRFPGANTPEDFWSNLVRGVSSISRFSEEHLLAQGISRDLFERSDYVPAAGVIADYRYFDPEFFGISVREAELIDPQQRIALECAWETFERAGYDPQRLRGKVGVFAGGAYGDYGQHVYSRIPEKDAADRLIAAVGRANDYIATRIAYKLNLRGPCINVQTACSTALVALHLASTSLRSGECDMCLVGGVSLEEIRLAGYVYLEGGMLSPDGVCRAFDAKAEGTVFSTGIGFVLLKRLDDAIRDRDSIKSVVKGSAVNNDGNAKAGFFMPSVDGQSLVISDALANAGIRAQDVSYVEAHGTATPIGDVVEVEALTRAFRKDTQENQFCALGSVKSNIGHLNHAAGISGLIKTSLALEHKTIPPTLFFETPNPNIEFSKTPFFVAKEVLRWDATRKPRRAGVTALGFGGTNAHVILEEAPDPDEIVDAPMACLLPISARTKDALTRQCENLGHHLTAHPHVNVADVAYTLQTGRSHFSHRVALVSADRSKDLAKVLVELQAQEEGNPKRRRPLVFYLPGEIEIVAGAATTICNAEPWLRDELHRLGREVKRLLDVDVMAYLCDETGHSRSSGYVLVSKAASFCIQLALSRLLARWNVVPDAYFGFGIGEYAIAALTGVMEEGVSLEAMAEQARTLNSLPEGGMLRIPTVHLDLIANSDVDVTYIDEDVFGVSGALAELQEIGTQLKARNETSLRVRQERDRRRAALVNLGMRIAKLTQANPRVDPSTPVASSILERWWDNEQVLNDQYWNQQACSPVRLHGIAKRLSMRLGKYNVLQLGGSAWGSRVFRRGEDVAGSTEALLADFEGSGSRPYEDFLRLVGNLWTKGADIDWEAMNTDKIRHKVILPTYPFERREIWFKPEFGAQAGRLDVTGSATSKQVLSPIQSRGTSRPTVSSRNETAGIKSPTGQNPLIVSSLARNAPEVLVHGCQDALGTLIKLCKEMLRIDTLDPNASFFEVGGDSIRGTQLAWEIKKFFEVSVEVEDLLNLPIEKLASHVESMRAFSSAKTAESDQATDRGDLISQICSRVLKLPNPDLSRSFLESGGDSIRAVQFLAEVQKATGVMLEIEHVLEKPLKEIIQTLNS